MAAAVFRTPHFSCPHIPVAWEHSTAKRDDQVWGGWAAHFSNSGLPRPTGFPSSPPGSTHTQSLLPGSPCRTPPGPSLPHLTATESCLPHWATGWFPPCAAFLMCRRPGRPRVCVSALVSGWDGSPQGSGPSQVRAP